MQNALGCLCAAFRWPFKTVSINFKTTGLPNQRSHLREGWNAKPSCCCMMEKRLNGCSTMNHYTNNITHSALLHTLSYLILQKQCWKILNGIHTIQTQFCLLILKPAHFLEKSVMVHIYNLSFLGAWGYKKASPASSKGFKAILGNSETLLPQQIRLSQGMATRHQKP